MKNYYLLWLLLVPFQIFSQDYKLFTATSQKLFTDYPVPFNTYSLSIESAKQIGTDSVYYNFFKLSSDWIESDTCEFWGGNWCNQQNAPSWAGPKIEFDNVFTYRFYNLNNDTLNFLFTAAINGPVRFYEDSLQKFSLEFIKTDTLTVLEQPDSAVYFQIAHTDLDGNPINSALNGEHIIISKEFGLVRFFVIDSFPSVLKPISLIGNVSPTAGFYQLTNEMVYDYQAGDEIQYKETSWYQPPAPPWYYYTRFRKHIFLEREQTDDYLKYSIRQELFYQDSVGIEIDTISKQFLRSETIAEIPFEKYDGSTRSLQLSAYCDELRWTYSIDAMDGPVYCEADTCWGTDDTQGPPEFRYSSYTLGLGLHTYTRDRNWDMGESYHIQKRIVFFKKDAEECGDEVIVGIQNFEKSLAQLTLNPNPATTVVRISSSVEIRRFLLTDLYGNLLFVQSVSNKEITIDVSPFSDGLYFVRILLKNGEVATKKLVVSKKF
ncbi:MAG: T9SS type A sorting domain-containing protein [Bacteroidales bacterium]|nr:T9SS type A sorting domain-containing protein [Bacteroidales bacterium]